MSPEESDAGFCHETNDACRPVDPVGDGPVASLNEDSAHSFRGPRVLLQVSAAGTEAVNLRAAIAAINDTLAKDVFWERFADISARYQEIWIGPEYRQEGLPAGMADADGAVAIVRNTEGAYHRFQSAIVLTGTYYSKGDDYVGSCSNPAGDAKGCRASRFNQNYSNKMVVTHGIGLQGEDGRELVSIELGREVFDRYNSDSVFRKSCTYNSIAHEWMHTLGKNQENHWTVVVDTGRNISSDAVKLSYLFGSAVQCCWLQDEGEIGPSKTELYACVDRFGAARFNSGECQ